MTTELKVTPAYVARRLELMAENGKPTENAVMELLALAEHLKAMDESEVVMTGSKAEWHGLEIRKGELWALSYFPEKGCQEWWLALTREQVRTAILGQLVAPSVGEPESILGGFSRRLRLGAPAAPSVGATTPDAGMFGWWELFCKEEGYERDFAPPVAVACQFASWFEYRKSRTAYTPHPGVGVPASPSAQYESLAPSVGATTPEFKQFCGPDCTEHDRPTDHRALSGVGAPASPPATTATPDDSKAAPATQSATNWLADNNVPNRLVHYFDADGREDTQHAELLSDLLESYHAANSAPATEPPENGITNVHMKVYSAPATEAGSRQWDWKLALDIASCGALAVGYLEACDAPAAKEISRKLEAAIKSFLAAQSAPIPAEPPKHTKWGTIRNQAEVRDGYCIKQVNGICFKLYLFGHFVGVEPTYDRAFQKIDSLMKSAKKFAEAESEAIPAEVKPDVPKENQ